MISSSIPFPPVRWWTHAVKSGAVTTDLGEYYQKMSYRNRYYLASPNGKTLMSLPLAKGRNQRMPLSEVKLFNESNWQDNHWKTIVSLYGRSPFFEYFEHLVKPLFETKYEYLHDFNTASLELINKILDLQLKLSTTREYRKTYPADTIDLRSALLPQDSLVPDTPVYYQVFAERCGFIADCSILDLLFCEGNYAREILLR